MHRRTRRPALRALVAAMALAAGMVGAAPAQAVDGTGDDIGAPGLCTTHHVKGATITVGGQPVRVPAVDVTVCRSAVVGVLVPEVTTVTSGPDCSTNCLAILVDSASPAYTVSVSYALDGNGGGGSVTIPAVPGPSMCVFGVGFPSPPVGGCFISIDPDDVVPL